jgi:hypothetical protein
VLGELAASERIRIADRELIDSFPDLPVRIPPGRHPVYAYRWNHPRRGPITVALVIPLRPARLPTVERLEIANDIRPDLDAGIIVDSGEVTVRADSGESLTTASGLGDGYYPVHLAKDAAGSPSALIVDFEIWKTRRYAVLAGQRIDEFGLVERVG